MWNRSNIAKSMKTLKWPTSWGQSWLQWLFCSCLEEKRTTWAWRVSKFSNRKKQDSYGPSCCCNHCGSLRPGPLLPYVRKGVCPTSPASYTECLCASSISKQLARPHPHYFVPQLLKQTKDPHPEVPLPHYQEAACCTLRCSPPHPRSNKLYSSFKENGPHLK